MLRQLERSRGNILGFSVADDLTEDEVQQGISWMRDAIAQHGAIRVLFRLTDMSLASFFTALDERFEFVREHADDIDRVAVVSDDKATELLSKVGAGFGAIETEHFAPEEEDKAWAWLQ
jgi:hypothetical protein